MVILGVDFLYLHGPHGTLSWPQSFCNGGIRQKSQFKQVVALEVRVRPSCGLSEHTNRDRINKVFDQMKNNISVGSKVIIEKNHYEAPNHSCSTLLNLLKDESLHLSTATDLAKYS